jgi:hypothetical protein
MMATAKKAPAKKTAAKKPAPKVPPVLEFEDGFYWIVSGNKRLNAGRSQRYAQNMLDDLG